MKHTYSSLFLLTTLCLGMLLGTSSKSLAMSPNHVVDTTKTLAQKQVKKSVIVDTRTNRPQDIKITYKPFTPFAFNYKSENENSKVLSNVKIFPNPVSDQINLAFRLTKDIKVTIKIMDALGNEITTLLAQRLTAGEQSQSFAVNGKLNNGYYFIRVMAGSETVVKRIQVL